MRYCPPRPLQTNAQPHGRHTSAVHRRRPPLPLLWNLQSVQTLGVVRPSCTPPTKRRGGTKRRRSRVAQSFQKCITGSFQPHNRQAPHAPKGSRASRDWPCPPSTPEVGWNTKIQCYRLVTAPSLARFVKSVCLHAEPDHTPGDAYSLPTLSFRWESGGIIEPGTMPNRPSLPMQARRRDLRSSLSLRFFLARSPWLTAGMVGRAEETPWAIENGQQLAHAKCHAWDELKHQPDERGS